MKAKQEEKYKTFWRFFKETKKYKELWREDASLIALILSVLFSILLGFLFVQNNSSFFVYVSSVLINIVCGFLGLLGVVITGMALLLSTISNDLINYINQHNKINNFVGVLFCFYFAAALILITIVTFLLEYFIIKIEYMAICWLVLACIIVSCYMFFLSICYTVALMGTCINFFVLECNRLNQRSDI